MKVCSDCHGCYDDVIDFCTDESHSPLSETRSGSTEMIAGYRLDMLVESDAKSDTYRARQTESGQSCLIKILSADAHGSPQILEEARLAAALFHPNVADIYEAGTLESGEVFAVAEDAEGESLRELLDKVGVPHLLTSIQVVRQAAEALHAIHLKGLLHRAIRPENIILTTDAEHRLLVRIKDLDFGGAREQAIVSNKFLIDNEIDSLIYFAPEQCSAEAAGIKTDVYSLGIVFYEMLAGVPPFEAEKAAALIAKHKGERPPDIKINNFDLRMLLTHTLMESLQKRPEARQPSANALARQMRHIEQLATHVSTPPPAGVVPPARQKTVTAFTVAPPPTIIQPAAAMETQKAVYEENTQPFGATAKNEPAIIFKVESDPPATAFKNESEPFVAIEPADSVDDLIEIPYLSYAQRAVEDFVPVVESVVPVIENFAKEASELPVSRLSRLRVRMKKLHHLKPTTPLPVPVSKQPTLIAWEQPEDDVPSVADVMEVLSKEQLAEIPVVYEEREEIAAAPLHREPAMIEWEQPAGDIPSIAVLSDRPVDGLPQMMPAAKAEPEAVIAVPQSPKEAPIPVNCEEPEEITIVRAPGKPIRIEWEQPAAQNSLMQASNELTFFPTILGAAERRKTIDRDRKDAMFSAYYPAAEARSYRPHMVGGGFAALIVLFFLFGDDLVRTYSSSMDPGGPVEAKTITQQESLPLRQTGDVTLSKQKTIKSFRTPVPERDEIAEDRPMPSPVKARTPLTSERPSASQKTLKPALVPSTLVISSGNGKINVKTEKQPSSTNKTADITRPRIVKDPKP